MEAEEGRGALGDCLALERSYFLQKEASKRLHNNKANTHTGFLWAASPLGNLTQGQGEGNAPITKSQISDNSPNRSLF